MKKTMMKIMALVLCVVMAALCLTACGSGNSSASAKSPLVGTWAANEAEGMSYVFDEDGTGKWDMGGDAAMHFTYEDKGATVEITYEGTSSADAWEYSIDGSTLTMTDSDTGSVLTYTKK